MRIKMDNFSMLRIQEPYEEVRFTYSFLMLSTFARKTSQRLFFMLNVFIKQKRLVLFTLKADNMDD